MNKTSHAEQDYSYAIETLEGVCDEGCIEGVISAAALKTAKQGKVVTENSIFDAFIEKTFGPYSGEGSSLTSISKFILKNP